MTDNPDHPADEDELVRSEQEWLLGQLRRIPAERAALEAKERDLVRSARAADVAWERIAGALGTTAAEALKKHGEPPEGEAPF